LASVSFRVLSAFACWCPFFSSFLPAFFIIEGSFVLGCLPAWISAFPLIAVTP
jgi:hypothetical protein